MVILIDPPAWPAHSTLFSHLISDESLAELHSFAERSGIPPRAFDEDHYDIAAGQYGALLEAGAVPVPGSELIRSLRRSGLRVPSRERPAKARAGLTHRWGSLMSQREDLAEDLLRRWSEPHRHYHGASHLLAVLTRLDELASHHAPAHESRPSEDDAGPVTGPSRRVRLAAWFHDAVYEGEPGRDEEASAALAQSILASEAAPLADQVAGLVRCTADHRVPERADADLRWDAALLIDADLGVLAGPAATYERYVAAVRADYSHVGDGDWRRGRAAVLTRLLAAQPIFQTHWARDTWEAAARANLERELARLS